MVAGAVSATLGGRVVVPFLAMAVPGEASCCSNDVMISLETPRSLRYTIWSEFTLKGRAELVM